MLTRDRLIEAAYKCFSQKGYLGATTKEIAQTAGVSEVTLFRHFRSKKELFEEVLRKYSVIPDIEKIKTTPSLSKEERFRKITREILYSLREKSDFVKILLSEVTLHPEEVSEIFKNFIEKLDSLIAETLFLEKKTARLFHCALFGYFMSEVIFLRKEIKAEDIEELADEFIKLYLRCRDE